MCKNLHLKEIMKFKQKELKIYRNATDMGETERKSAFRQQKTENSLKIVRNRRKKLTWSEDLKGEEADLAPS